jgi:hypothetical protein
MAFGGGECFEVWLPSYLISALDGSDRHLHSLLLYSQWMRLQYSLNRRLGGPQTWCVHFGVEKNLLPVYLSTYHSCENEEMDVSQWGFKACVLRVSSFPYCRELVSVIHHNWELLLCLGYNRGWERDFVLCEVYTEAELCLLTYLLTYFLHGAESFLRS